MKYLGLFVLLLAVLAAPVHAQTWTTIGSEGSSQGSSPVVQLPSGVAFRFGAGNSFCDTVTTTAPISITVWYSSIPNCTVAGKVTSDPAPGQQKSLQVAQGTSPVNVSVTTAGVTATIPVPALPVTSGRTVVAIYTCTGPEVYTLYSDGSFTHTGSCQ